MSTDGPPFDGADRLAVVLGGLEARVAQLAAEQVALGGAEFSG